MATTNRARFENMEDGNDRVFSYFQKTVCLHDWWLVKADKDFKGKRLSVAGSSSSREFEAVRLFTSAPIVKIYDALTLHTRDGVCVCLKGFINKQRTIENGFSTEVFDHFVFGFPPYWEEYMKKCFGPNLTSDIEFEVSPNASEYATDSGSYSDPDLNMNLSEHEEVVNQNKHARMRCGENASKRLRSSRPYSSRRKESRRELFCEKVASPVSYKRGRKQAAVSPEILNVKCSRSGRVLLPPLEFWRNQIPVYDGNRRITGIMEEVDTEKPSGSKSEPQKQRNRPRVP